VRRASQGPLNPKTSSMPTLSPDAIFAEEGDPAERTADVERIAVMGEALVVADPGDVEALQRDGWYVDCALGVAEVSVESAGEDPLVIAALETLISTLGERVLHGLRVAAIEDDEPLERQTRVLLRAPTVQEFLSTPDLVVRDVLAERPVETWYQPVVELQRDPGLVWGHECLMRVPRPGDGEIVAPLALFDAARASGLLSNLDDACRRAHIGNVGQLDDPSGMRFLINCIPDGLIAACTDLTLLLKLVEDAGLGPADIVFEIVETEKMEDRAELASALNAVSTAGFGVALDDVGSGYSSLGVIADLEPDIIKIDRDLVVGAARSTGHSAVCRSLIDLAHRRSMRVIAEGIETPLELEMMRRLGADMAQGYLIGGPSPDCVDVGRIDLDALTL